jgi:protein SCO1/2
MLLCAAASDTGFDPQIGSTVPVALALYDDDGRELTVGGAIAGKPAILALVYYRCPNICSFVLADLTKALGGVSSDYSLLVASIDPDEAPRDGAEARGKYGGEARRNWHFLTGDAGALEQAVGYKARRDPRNSGQFIHPTGLVFLSPQGRITSYLMGLGYSSDSLRAALGGQAQAPASVIRLLCFDYDAKAGRYSLAITRILTVLSALTAASLAAYVVFARGRR